ncbi:MAG: 3,4-dihydroxy-2-butanone-4-phosphate synthase [Pseudomonadales bacterium]|nr:3,4-dihydroxy-2-butanone-4-phosphate synthase [Gammaproteobacteria bacterium]NNL57598.1 3,4-dihydroxy-2-butanone-4-phosphate synthase [Pseudomonadales bacterium]
MRELNSTEELIDDIRQGKMVILMDDEDRENEGDLVVAAECVTPEIINFMAREGRGLICMPMSQSRCEQLDLPLMVDHNRAAHGTNFTISIEAASGVTTGISAADRACTVQAAASKNAQPQDIVQPGHIFPLMAQPGGVLVRAGHTEASVDLARLAGFGGSAVIVEIINDDGNMARREDLDKFAQKHKLKIGTIADLIHYRLLHDKTIELLERGMVSTDHGEFEMYAFGDMITGDTHLALVKGKVADDEPVLVRVHTGSAVRDLFGAQLKPKPDWNMQRCLARIAAEGRGVLVLLAGFQLSEGWLQDAQIALGKKAKPSVPVSKGTASLNVGVGSQILRQLGVSKMRLMGPEKHYNAISGFDLEVVEWVGCS